MTLTREQAIDTLQALSVDALTRERAHPYCPQSERTATYIIDGSPCYEAGWQSRIRLAVMALYDDWSEGKVAIAASATVEKIMAKRPPTATLVYECYWENVTVRLNHRNLALRLLTEGDLPPEVRGRITEERRRAREFAANDDPFAGLVPTATRAEHQAVVEVRANEAAAVFREELAAGVRRPWGGRRPSSARLLPAGERKSAEVGS